MKGKLYLLPNVFEESQDHKLLLPLRVQEIVEVIDGLFAESAKGGRAFLKRYKIKKPLQEMPVILVNEHLQKKEISELLKPLERGEHWGLVSDAGLPCIADPGKELVSLAHQHNISVEAVPGPSSIIMALQLSGFSGQNFCFHGYLPKEEGKRVQYIKMIENEARKFSRTGIFIETPYRSKKMAEELIKILAQDTYLAIGWDLTLPTETVISRPVRMWKDISLSAIEKKPAVFLVSCPN